MLGQCDGTTNFLELPFRAQPGPLVNGIGISHSGHGSFTGILPATGGACRVSCRRGGADPATTRLEPCERALRLSVLSLGCERACWGSEADICAPSPVQTVSG